MPYYISLIHSLVEVIVNLLAFLVDHSSSLVNDFNLLALFALNGDLKAFLLLPDIIDLLLKVNNEALHSVDQMILSLQLQGELVLLLPETLTVLLEVPDISLGVRNVTSEMRVSICLHIYQLC